MMLKLALKENISRGGIGTCKISINSQHDTTCTRNLQISSEPPKTQAQGGTSLLKSAATNQRRCPEDSAG